jgi:hypothetical protein
MCDRALFRELAKRAIVRTVAAAKKAVRKPKGPADPLADVRPSATPVARGCRHVHGANLDLGVALITGLTVVDQADINVARFFVICGRPSA